MLATSCKDFLEIEPEFKFREELAVGSLDGLEKTTTGAFNQIQSGNLYGGGFISYTEILVDNISTDPLSDFSLNQLRLRNMSPLNSQASNYWNEAYRAIHIANTVLENLPNFEEEDPMLVSQLRGECLFIRGTMHFELVRLFAQTYGFSNAANHLGIPIRLTPGSAVEGQETARSTVAEVYDRVVEDLSEAKLLLPTSRSARANQYAASAFLMRAEFERQNYQAARDEADLIITSNVFRIDSPLLDMYRLGGDDISPEVIFQMVNIQEDNSNGDIVGKFRFTLLQTPIYRMSPTFIDLIQTDSLQGSIRSDELYTRNNGNYYTKKYSNINQNIAIIRLPEVLLTRAECNARLGAADAVVRDDINIVKQRAGIALDNSSSGLEALLNSIVYERTIELAHEGDRFHDVKRRKLTIETNIGNFSWDDPRLVFPIPQQEVDNNPAMVQNSGY